MPKKISKNNKLYGRYWEQFVKDLKTTNLTLGGEKIQSKLTHEPKPKYNYNIPIATKGVYLALTLSTREKRRGIEIYLHDSDYKEEFYNRLHKDKKVIEKRLGLDLDWRELSGTKRSRIVYENFPFNPKDDTDLNWNKQNEWFKKMIKKFDDVFMNRVKSIEADIETK